MGFESLTHVPFVFSIVSNLFTGLPTLQHPDRENGRRVLQPHDVCCLRHRVLLALHERDFGPALPESIRLHFLGEEALVAKEEAILAAGHSGRSSGGNRPLGWHRRPSHDHWHSLLGRQENTQQVHTNRAQFDEVFS